MVVMAFLRRADLVFKPQYLCTVFTQGAVHIVSAIEYFAHTIGKGRDHLWVIVQIARFDKFNVGIVRRHLVCKAIDAVNQDTGEQEVWEHHNTLVTQACHMIEARCHQWEGHSGITNLGPTKAHTLPQHTGNLRHIRIGVWI